MASLLFFLYPLLAPVSCQSWDAIALERIELIAFGDNTETMDDFGPFGVRSNYWSHIWYIVGEDLEGSSRVGYYEDWPIVEHAYDTLAVYSASPYFEWRRSKEEAYNNVSARFNNFDPETVQQYMRNFINASIMFQVKGASAPTPGLLGDAHVFDFSTCIVDNPPKIWLTTLCQMNSLGTDRVEIWGCQQTICQWRTVWSEYIFPNAASISGNSGSGVSDYKVDIQYDLTYTSYCDLQADIAYNGGEITASAMKATLYANFPPIVSGNVTGIDLDCDVVALTCINSNYCTWTLPWLDRCNYTVDACDTTTTTRPPTTNTHAPSTSPTRSRTYAPSTATSSPTTDAPTATTNSPTTDAPTATTSNPTIGTEYLFDSEPANNGNNNILTRSPAFVLIIIFCIFLLI